MNVVVINGKPRSGKDTFCKYIEEWCEQNNKDCFTWSTIDLEKEIFEEIVGREYDPNYEEVENDRAFLQEFKQILNKYYDVTYNSFVNLLEFYSGVILIQSREWNEILDFGIYCEKRNIPFTAIYIENPNAKVFNNPSDKNCNRNIEDYDVIINNDGDLERLKQYAEEFCKSRLL